MRLKRKPNLQLRKIVLEETNDGRDIIRFLKNVIVHIEDGPKTFGIRPQDFARNHKIDAARILAKLGFEEGERYLRRTYVRTPFRRVHPKDEDAPKRDMAASTADLYRLVRQKTNDGADIMLNFIEIMKGYHPEFKPHLRMAAAKELVRQIEFDYEEEPTSPTPEPTRQSPASTNAEPTQTPPASTNAEPTSEPSTPPESNSDSQPTNPVHPTNPVNPDSDKITANHPNQTNHSSDNQPNPEPSNPVHPINPANPAPDNHNHISKAALKAYQDYTTHNCAPEEESIYHSIIRRASDQPDTNSARQEAERLITEFNQFIAKTDPEHPPVAVPDEIITRTLTQRPDLPFDPGDYYDLDRDDFYFCQCRDCDQCDEFDYFIEFLIELEEETDHLYEDP